MTREQKNKIAARLFFQDNREDYDSYEQAVKEASEHMSDSFVDTVVRGVTKPRKGYRILFRESDGHVVAVRTKDDFLQPITEMTTEDGAEIEKAFDALAEKNDACWSSLVLLQHCGWALV